MAVDHPYPNPFEILRYLRRSLDLKLSDKRLDDLAAKRIYDPRELEVAISHNYFNVSEKYLGTVAARVMSKAVKQFLAHYLHDIVGKTPADGVSRKMVIELLIKTSVKDCLISLVTEFQRYAGGPQPSFWFSTGTNTVAAMFGWLADHEPNWRSFLEGLPKELRDSISAWKKGKELPSAQSIRLLSKQYSQQENNQYSINGDQFKALLFVSRAIDFIRKEELGLLLIDECRVSIWGADNNTNLSASMKFIQDNVLGSLGSKHQLIGKLQHGLHPKVEKSDPEQYQKLISEVREIIKSTDYLRSTEYWIEWYDARWHVYSGDLKKANSLYKSATEKAAFVAGYNLECIVEEALVVAASQSNEDGVFLKQLKCLQINFGYDIPSVSRVNPSQKVWETIEYWELDLWRSNFSRVFPKTGLFPGIDYKSEKGSVGPMMFPDSKEIKPDYRNPNRVIKVGDEPAMPQLVWFTRKENIEVCKKLLERGADVNVQGKDGYTPILAALDVLNVRSVPPRSLNDDLFQLISKESHAGDIINTRTQRERFLPIISAVETGRPDIVKWMLDMKANPNGRGLSDEQTPLNVCLKHIGMIKNPDFFWSHQRVMPLTSEALDSVRRISNGLTGFTLSNQEQFLANSKNDPLYIQLEVEAARLMSEQVLGNMSVESMRDIAIQLIKKEADVNAEHASPLRGYTPLMLAAELDEREIFELMLVSGGDIDKTYQNPETGKDVSVFQIAGSFGSAGVLQALREFSAKVPVR